MHVVAGRAGLSRLTVATLQEQPEDFIGYAGGDSSGQTAFACRDAEEVRNVGAALGQQSADAIANHLAGERYG